MIRCQGPNVMTQENKHLINLKEHNQLLMIIRLLVTGCNYELKILNYV